MKRKFYLAALVLALCFVLSGSAWAGHSADIIDISALAAGDSYTNWSYDGSKITVLADTTVTGTVSSMTTPTFDFNIAAGATVKWEANVTGGPGTGNVVNIRGAGMFEVVQGQIKGDVNNENFPGVTAIFVDGGQLKVSGGDISASGTTKGGANAIYALNNSTVTISGGTITAAGNATDHSSDINNIIGIAAVESAVTINGGTISASGTAEEIIAILAAKGSTATINGGTISVSGNTNYLATLDISGTSKVTVASGVTLTNGSGCRINIDEGTLYIYGSIINNGIINNDSSHSIIVMPGGGLYNTETGEVYSPGHVENSGTIDNKGVFKSAQTASEIGGTITGNPIQPLNSSSGSGGGCNAGFGLFGLLALAVWVARKRMTA